MMACVLLHAGTGRHGNKLEAAAAAAGGGNVRSTPCAAAGGSRRWQRQLAGTEAGAGSGQRGLGPDRTNTPRHDAAPAWRQQQQASRPAGRAPSRVVAAPVRPDAGLPAQVPHLQGPGQAPGRHGRGLGSAAGALPPWPYGGQARTAAAAAAKRTAAAAAAQAAARRPRQLPPRPQQLLWLLHQAKPSLGT